MCVCVEQTKKENDMTKKTLKEIRVTIIFVSHLTDLVRCQIVSLNKTEKKFDSLHTDVWTPIDLVKLLLLSPLF